MGKGSTHSTVFAKGGGCNSTGGYNIRKVEGAEDETEEKMQRRARA